MSVLKDVYKYLLVFKYSPKSLNCFPDNIPSVPAMRVGSDGRPNGGHTDSGGSTGFPDDLPGAHRPERRRTEPPTL